jgi:thymidylate synthase (FAD)
MKLINSSVIVKEQESGIDGVYKQIEWAGRHCYKSLDKITENSAKEFVDRMIKLGHGAMLEHGTVYLTITATSPEVRKYEINPYSRVKKISVDGINGRAYITTNYRVLVENKWLDDLKYQCDPTPSHEKRITVKWTLDRVTGESFLRHRVFSFARESTRYCNYSKDKFNNEITFIKPSWWDELGTTHKQDFEIFLENCEEQYLEFIEQGWKPQQARQVLPFAVCSPLVMTGFKSDWEHFLSLRTSKNAHPDAQRLSLKLKELLYDEK